MAIHPLLQSASLPDNYRSVTQEVHVRDRKVGCVVVVSSPAQASRVVVRIDFSDLRGLAARRAATKGYVNSFVDSLVDLGFKVIDQGHFDVSNEVFAKPVSIGLIFTNSDGKRVWTRQEVFFTNYGFVAQIIAEDFTSLVKLALWVRSIKAVDCSESSGQL